MSGSLWTGGQRRALQKFDSSKITIVFVRKYHFQNRSKSLQNHPTKVFRAVEHRDIEKKFYKSLHKLLIKMLFSGGMYWRGTTKKRIPNFLQNTKIVINGSPRGRFEHLGVETG